MFLFGHQMGALKSQFNLILFNLTNLFLFGHQLGALKIQFNLFNKYVLIWKSITHLYRFVSQRQVWSTSQYFDCSRHTGSIPIYICFWLLLSYRWVCTNVLVATCIFLTRGTFPNCSIENIHLVSAIWIIWGSIPNFIFCSTFANILLDLQKFFINWDIRLLSNDDSLANITHLVSFSKHSLGFAKDLIILLNNVMMILLGLQK